MTNASKTLSGIFVVLLVVTALLKWGSTSSTSKAFRTSIVDVDTTKVDKIIVDNPVKDKAVELKKNGKSWTVADKLVSTSYPADGQMIDAALSQLNELKVKAVATRDPKKYTRYKVDSTGTNVMLYNGNKKLGGVILGAPQVVSRREFNSYVRPDGDKSVYTVDGFLGSTFSADVYQWRDKDVWNLDQDNIARIDFMMPADSSYSIIKSKNNQWVSGKDTLKSSAVSSMLDKFSLLKANGFVDSLSTSDFGTELYAIQLQMDDGTQKTLRLKPAKSNDNKFIAVASGFKYVFTLYKSSLKNSLLKPRNELLK